MSAAGFALASPNHPRSAAQYEQKWESSGIVRPQVGHFMSLARLRTVGAEGPFEADAADGLGVAVCGGAAAWLEASAPSGRRGCGLEVVSADAIVEELEDDSIAAVLDESAVTLRRRRLNSLASGIRFTTSYANAWSTTAASPPAISGQSLRNGGKLNGASAAGSRPESAWCMVAPSA